MQNSTGMGAAFADFQVGVCGASADGPLLNHRKFFAEGLGGKLRPLIQLMSREPEVYFRHLFGQLAVTADQTSGYSLVPGEGSGL